MKKTYMLLLALLLVSGQATWAQEVAERHPMTAFTPRQAVKSEWKYESSHRVKPMVAQKSSIGRAPLRMDIISDQPEGELRIYSREGCGYYTYWSYMYGFYQNGHAMRIVFGSDGKSVYLQDPVSSWSNGNWVAGTLSDDGKTITVPLYQYLYYYTDMEWGGVLAMVDLTIEDDGTVTATCDETVTEVTYTIDGDVITLNGTSGDFNGGGCHGLGIVWDDNHEWAGYVDWDSKYILFTEQPVTMPEGATTEVMSMMWQSDGATKGKMVTGAFVGNDVYIKGFSTNDTSAVMHGTIDGTTATFVSDQYVGIGAGYFLKMWGGTYSDVTDSYRKNDALSFTYDASTHILSTTKSLLVMGGNDYLEAYDQPVFNRYIDHAATPADPSVLSFEDDYFESGYSWGEFNVPTVDVDGNFISPDQLSYVIYVDNDEVFTFGPDEYETLDEYMTELPYNFNDGWNIYTGAQYIYFYETGFSRIGIQSIFRGGGEEHRSNIVYMDLTEDPEPQSDATQPLSNWMGDESMLSTTGTYKLENYDVATHFEDASLEGVTVKGLRIPVPDGCTATNYAVWLTTELGLTTRDGVKHASADLAWQTGTAADGWVEVIFDESYTIGKDGFYAGYSFDLTELSSTGDYEPVTITSDKTGGLWLRTSRTYRTWVDMTSSVSGSAAIELILAGDNVHEHAAVLVPETNYYVKKGEALSLDVTVINHGTEALQSLDYSYELAGYTGTAHIDLGENALSGDYYGRSTTTTIELPAIENNGDYTLHLNVYRVNDKANQDIAPERTGLVHVLEVVPQHHPLVEEYTGTWCGWCTRGLAAMKALAEHYGDDFIGVAYHNGDPMEIMSSSEYPSSIAGFPSAFVDRAYEVDPYYGYDYSLPLGITEVIDYRATELALADVKVKANWADDDKTELKATAEVYFAASSNEDIYRVELMLVEDDMYGEAGTDWDQTNYYSSYAGLYDSDPYIKEITEWPATVEGYHFNDVLVATSGIIDGSLPANIVTLETYNTDYTFYPDYICNTSGETLIQDKEQLSVVAVVVNTKTGQVVNAAKAKVGASDGIGEVLHTGKQVASTRYYDLQGHEVTNPTNGNIYIKQIRFTDGSQVSVKVLNK